MNQPPEVMYHQKQRQNCHEFEASLSYGVSKIIVIIVIMERKKIYNQIGRLVKN